MQIFSEIGPLRTYLNDQRANRLTIGLVPTMGALHTGHLSLIKASKNHNDITVCSIYVNPVQFNNPSDLQKYPRTLEKDLKMLEDTGCDVVFTPSNNEMYHEPSQLKFDFGSLDKVFEGEFRPGHFSGVALVVAKFFNIVHPTRAYFGQKDFQQFMVISKLVEELKFDLELVCAPIVREPDGLAMSSRNMRLNDAERQKAVILSKVLSHLKTALLAGKSFTSVKKDAVDRFSQEGVRLEYLEMANRKDLSKLDKIVSPDEVILLVAAFVGEVRLIDNVFLTDN